MIFHPAFSFEVVAIGEAYQIRFGDSFLCTHGAKPKVLSHPNKSFLEELVSEFQSFTDITVTADKTIAIDGDVAIPFCLYGIYSDSQNVEYDTLQREYLPGFLYFDGVLRDVAGPERVDQLNSYECVHTYYRKFLGQEGLEFLLKAGRSAYFRVAAGMSEAEMIAELGEHEVLTESEFRESEVCAALLEEFRGLSHPEKAACIGLRDAHDSASILASMAFIRGGISSNQYATAALAALMIRPVFSDSADDYQSIYAQVRADAMTAQVFVKHMRSEDLELESMIQAGESADQEFKSSMRIATEKQSDEATLKLSVLKTVAGFLNAQRGGRLIIGVRDDGSILGIDHDNYQNDDKYMLALTNLLSESLGASALENIAIEIRTLREKKVCLISVQPSKTMVFCTYKKKNIDGEVFVRLGPSTRSLKASEVIEFNKTRFGG